MLGSDICTSELKIYDLGIRYMTFDSRMLHTFGL